MIDCCVLHMDESLDIGQFKETWEILLNIFFSVQQYGFFSKDSVFHARTQPVLHFREYLTCFPAGS